MSATNTPEARLASLLRELRARFPGASSPNDSELEEFRLIAALDEALGSRNPIAAAREGKGWTQVTLALRSRLSLSTIRNAERGLATTATLTAITRALAVNFDAIRGRKP